MFEKGGQPGNLREARRRRRALNPAHEQPQAKDGEERDADLQEHAVSSVNGRKRTASRTGRLLCLLQFLSRREDIKYSADLAWETSSSPGNVATAGAPSLRVLLAHGCSYTRELPVLAGTSLLPTVSGYSVTALVTPVCHLCAVPLERTLYMAARLWHQTASAASSAFIAGASHRPRNDRSAQPPP